MVFAIKAEVKDPGAETFAFSEHKTMYGGKHITKGDTIFVYHTGDEKQVVGLAVADSDPFPDPKLQDPRRVVVRIRAGKPFPFAVPLSTFRSDPILAATDLVRLPRLSVIPMTATQERRLVERSGLEAK